MYTSLLYLTVLRWALLYGAFLDEDFSRGGIFLEGVAIIGEPNKARLESITNVDGLYTPQKLDLPDPTTIGKKEPV